MKRREFIAELVGAVIWPVVAAAQGGKTPTIGILVLGTPDPAPFLNELKGGLRELGYVEGQNIQFEFRSANKNAANLAPLAAELVALKVEVLVAYQTPAIAAAKHATSTIPIVMGGAGDPVGTGLVASLARPGGNITGVSGATAELAAKNLDVIHELLPSARRVAVLANATDPFSKPFLQHIEAAAKALVIDIKPVLVKNAGELDADVADITQWQAQAVIVQPTLPQLRIAELATKSRLPAFCPNFAFVVSGGLMSYGPDYVALYRQNASFVDKILKGRKPAELPVELPTKFWLVVNLKTAKAIGITVPETMLLRADQVIE